jgi:hypothetical protein
MPYSYKLTLGLQEYQYVEAQKFATINATTNHMIEMLRMTFCEQLDFGLNDRQIWIMWNDHPIIIGKFKIIEYNNYNYPLSAPAAGG